MAEQTQPNNSGRIQRFQSRSSGPGSNEFLFLSSHTVPVTASPQHGTTSCGLFFEREPSYYFSLVLQTSASLSPESLASPRRLGMRLGDCVEKNDSMVLMKFPYELR